MNTLIIFFCAIGNLHGYLREIDVLICTLLKATYPYILNEIQSANCNYHGNRPSYIGEEEMLSPRIVVSWQLGNESDVDPKDNKLSVVVLVVVLNEIDMNEVPRDWRFVLQNLRTTDGDKQRDGVSVQLFHGIVIIFDGKKVRHATTIPLDERYTRFGVFHGSTNPRGYKKYRPSNV